MRARTRSVQFRMSAHGRSRTCGTERTSGAVGASTPDSHGVRSRTYPVRSHRPLLLRLLLWPRLLPPRPPLSYQSCRQPLQMHHVGSSSVWASPGSLAAAESCWPPPANVAMCRHGSAKTEALGCGPRRAISNRGWGVRPLPAQLVKVRYSGTPYAGWRTGPTERAVP